MQANLDDGVLYDQPVTYAEREAIAADFVAAYQLTIPVLIDDMANSVDAAYQAFPNRLYIVATDGTTLFLGPEGAPVGQEDLADALAAMFP